MTHIPKLIRTAGLKRWSHQLHIAFNTVQQRFKKYLRPDFTFITLAILFGGVMLCVNPLFKTPDEVRHLYRAYQVSQGQLLPEKKGAALGGQLPKTVVNFDTYLSQKSNDITWRHYALLSTQDPPFSSSKEFVMFPNSALYSPVPYAPQATSLFLGRIFKFPLGLSVHLAQLFNLLTWIVLCCLSIRLIPRGKWFITVLALLPLSIEQAASLSPDTVTNGLSLLLIALFVKIYESTSLNWRILSMAAITSFLLGWCKQPYGLLSLLFLAVPTFNFRSLSLRIRWTVAIVALSAGSSLLWLHLINPLFVPTRTDIVISPSGQLHFVLLHPLKFLKATLHTYLLFGYQLLKDLIGGLSVVINIGMPLIGVIAGYSALLLALLGESRSSKFNFKAGFYTGMIAFTLFMSINLLIYLSWNPVGASSIQGMQSRYFLPVVALGSLWARPVCSLKHVRHTLIVSALSLWICIGFVSLLLIYRAYY